MQKKHKEIPFCSVKQGDVDVLLCFVIFTIICHIVIFTIQTQQVKCIVFILRIIWDPSWSGAVWDAPEGNRAVL